MTHQQIVIVVALRMPCVKKIPVTISRRPEMMYVEEIITRLPTESKSGPSTNGPAMFPTAKGIR